MNLSNAQKVRAVGVFLAAVGAVAYGVVSSGPSASAGLIEIYLPDGGGAQPGDVVVTANARALPSALAMLHAGGGPPDGGWSYWVCEVASAPADDGGGQDPGASIGPGMQVVFDDPSVTAATPGRPLVECWIQDRADAPFKCACALTAGPTCMVATPIMDDGGTLWAAGAHGSTFDVGQWATDGGCKTKICEEFDPVRLPSGELVSSSMPGACL